jgi:hypothetical protein
MTPQSPAADSGVVAGIPVTTTPMIAAAPLRGSIIARAENLGANPLTVEIAFSYDGITFDLWPTTAFGGPDGSGLPGGTSVVVPLPDKRPPWIRVRAQATVGTTSAQVQLYEYNNARSVDQRTRFIPTT